MTAGAIIGVLKLEKWVEPWVFEVHSEQQDEAEERMRFLYEHKCDGAP